MVGWGKTRDGVSTCVRVPFTPFFFIRIPESEAFSDTSQGMFKQIVMDRCRGVLTDKVRVVYKKPFYGYQGGKSVPFIQVVFSSLRDFRSARYTARDSGWKTFESACDPMIKFFHLANLDPVGWTHFESPSPVSDEQKTVRSKVVEYRMKYFRDVSMSTDPEVTQTIPPLIIASWDIECVSDSGGFPNGANHNDKIITIGCSYMRYGESEPFRNTVHQLGTCLPIDGADLFTYEKESALVNAWIEELTGMDTDVIIGFNIWGFDFKYIDDRSTTLIDFETGDSAIKLDAFGKALEGGGDRVEKNLQSSAYGNNKYIYHNTPGMIQLDLLMIFRKDLKLESYTLNNIAKTYLKDTEKIDLKPKEIFSCFKEDAPEGRTRIAEYCIRDCAIPLYLLNKLNVLTNQMEMAKVVCTPITFLNTRGQQIRCYSQIVRKARVHGFLVNDMDRDGKGATSSYVGATVLEPKVGAYMQDIVSCLDFGSLYPSIIRAHRMCPSTIVIDQTYGTLQGVEYYKVETTPGRIVSFAQTDDAVVPALLDDLSQWRKQAKRDMADAKKRGDTFATALYNAKQLAFKVSANSMYGLFGSSTGMMPCVDLASAVTSTGRDMIQLTSKKVLESGSKVVYGDTDSVFCIFNCGGENRTNLAAHMKKAQLMADTITKQFKAPNILEYEKVYYPFLLFSKKRYCGLMFEDDPTTPSKIDVKGLQVVRRDNCPLVREVSQEVMDILMYKRSFQMALEHARKRVLEVLHEQVPWTKLVVSKALRGNYKNPSSLPHWCVAQKRKARGEHILDGERIPYVFVKDMLNSDALLAKRAEDVTWAREHGLSLDTLYYVRQQLLNPICTYLSLEYPDPSKEILGYPDIASKMMALQLEETENIRESKRVKRLKKDKQQEITSFFRSSKPSS
jgi:DNA polymerase delta subunit 1